MYIHFYLFILHARTHARTHTHTHIIYMPRFAGLWIPSLFVCVCICVWLLSPALLGNSWLLISDQGQLVLISCTLYWVVCCSFLVGSLLLTLVSCSVSPELFPEFFRAFTEELSYSLWKMGSLFFYCPWSQSTAHCSPCAAEDFICTYCFSCHLYAVAVLVFRK